jgi:hypothetical protein
MNDAPEWIRWDFDDTKRLIETWSPLARGHFLTLIICQLERGSLPADLKALERLVPGTRRVWAEISSAFVERDGRLVNEYFDGRRAAANELIASYRKRGRDGMAARYGRSPDDEGGPSRQRRSSATSSGINYTASSASSSATSPAITQAVVSKSQEKERETSSSSSNRVRAASRGATPHRSDDDDDLDAEVRAEPDGEIDRAVGLLPARLSPADLAEAKAILASWPRSSMQRDLRRYLAEAAKQATFPHRYLMTCLRNHEAERAREPDRPSIAGRIDPTSLKIANDLAAAEAEKIRVNAILAGLDDATLERLKVAVLDADPNARKFMASANPRSSHLLRAAMAATLAQGATA